MNKMTMHDTGVSIKDVLMVLHEMGENTEECISLLQTALIYNRSLHLKDCKTKAESIRKQEVLLTKKIAGIISDGPDAGRYVSIPGHLSRIAENIEKFSDLLENKIQEQILFSDKAANETMFLLQRLI